MHWVLDDGGRHAAGYRGKTGDCVVRAIAIATGQPYRSVYTLLSEKAAESWLRRDRRSPRHGLKRRVYEAYLRSLGWGWTPCMRIGRGCRVHLRKDELPPGKLIVRLSGHLAAVIDGVLHDLSDCSRDGTRCVYGYYTPAKIGTA